MTARSHKRGWPTKWDGKQWVYEDSGESIEKERPCVRCGRMPDSQGRDACLGGIPGAISACCGHGVHEPITIKGGTK